MTAADKIKARKKLIIDILKSAAANRANGSCIRERISREFGRDISKGTLSSDIKALIKDGYDIVSDNDGYRLLNPNYDPEEDPVKKKTQSFEPVTPDTVAEWIVMVILSEEYDRYMSTQDISDKYAQLTKPLSISKIKSILRELEAKKYVSRHTIQEAHEAGQADLNSSGGGGNKLFYRICDAAPVISFIDRDKLIEFNDFYHDGGYARELGGSLKKINDKIAFICPDMYSEGSGAFKSTGIRNVLSEESMTALDDILRLPFRSCALNVKYREKENVKSYLFKTAMIIFNVETNSFYLLGEVKRKGRWIRKNLKLKSVANMSADENVANDIFESKKYRDIFNKMWSSAPDEPAEAEVWFKDVPDIREEIISLGKARRGTASVTFTKENEGWIRYRDRIMGMHDFLRFVRSLGDAAVIVKPGKSREHLIEKTGKMIEEYKKICRGK